MKECTACKQIKPFEAFHKNKGAKDGRQSRCKNCNNASVRKWQSENPDRWKEIWQKNSYGNESLIKRRASRYGLSVEELQRLLDQAGGVCEICKREPIKWLVVDHCHKSLKVRGIICERCNQALGLFQDNIEFMQNAIEYLSK